MSKEYTLAEVKEHSNPNDLWIVIENKVYDVTAFLMEHPGGEDSLIDVAGRDATKDFIDVGHSTDAREMMKKYCVGVLVPSETKKKAPIKQIALTLGAVFLGISLVYLLKRGTVRN